MPTEAEILKIIRKDPGRVREFPDASEKVMLACVKEAPSCYIFIQKPTAAVRRAAVKLDAYLIGELKNPTEAEQVAAMRQNGLLLYRIANPCRKAALISLKTYGKEYRDLHAKQVRLGSAFAASTVSLIDDIELQAAALSNIAGLRLFAEEPQLFNMDGLKKRCPRLLEVVTAWTAIGFDHRDADIINQQLKEAIPKRRKVTPEITVEIPTDLMLCYACRTAETLWQT